MTGWIAFKGYNNNQAVNASDVDLNNLRPFGVHWYSTAAEANAHPNSVISFPNPAAAIMIPFVNALIDDANNARDVASAPGNLPVVGPVIKGAQNAVGALTDVNTFLSRLTSPNTWIRAGEFVLGALLILAGALTLAGHNGDVVSLAKKVVK